MTMQTTERPAAAHGYSTAKPARPPVESSGRAAQRLPWLRACQPGSAAAQRAGVAIGQFYLEYWTEDEDDPDGAMVKVRKQVSTPEKPFVHLLPLGCRTPRILFDDTTDETKVLCSSDDGIFGVGEPGGDCATCGMARWQNDEKPRCPATLEFAGYCPQINGVARIQFQRGGIKLGYELADRLEAVGYGEVGWQFSLEAAQTGRFNYFKVKAAECSTDVMVKLRNYAYAAQKQNPLLSDLMCLPGGKVFSQPAPLPPGTIDMAGVPPDFDPTVDAAAVVEGVPFNI